MGRVRTVTYSKDGRVESYTYWPNGQVKAVTTSEGVTEYYYDERHRLDFELRPNGVRMDYGYDEVGNRTLVQVSRDGVVTTKTSYTYDALNRLDTVTNDLQPTDVTDYDYDDAGNLDRVTHANGLVTDYDYNTVNQLTDVYTRSGTGEVMAHYHYVLDDTGRREVIRELDGRTTAYCHDNLYRLTDEVIFDSPATAITAGCISDAGGADYVANYQYDWVGNRTYETVDGVQTAYQYDNNDRLEQAGGTVYGYDDNGNTVTETLDWVVKTYYHDGRNKLIRMEEDGVANGEYTYNHNGIRTSKTMAGATTQFIVDENRDYAQVLEEVVGGATQVHYTYGHDLLSQERGGDTRYYHYDGLGSTRALSDAGGSLTDSYDYEAFGEVLSQTGEAANDYLFTGEQFDASLNQYYLRARYYDQGIGRFTQMDTWMGDNQDPITLHKYAYGNADPVNYTDPTGNFGLGGFGVSLSIQGTLRAVSIGSSAYDMFMIATGKQELTANDVGMHLLLGGTGKLVSKLGKRYADSLMKFVKGLGCNSFAANTLITTQTGLTEIQNIKIGDKVLTVNEETGQHEYREVVHVISSTELKETLFVELSNGAFIESTPGHLIYVDEQWIAAEDIEAGQHLYSLGEQVTVVRIIASETKVKVYNLTVEGNHNYFVGEDGVLVHNISPCEKAAKQLSKLVPNKYCEHGY